jgi:hypothetical protein
MTDNSPAIHRREQHPLRPKSRQGRKNASVGLADGNAFSFVPDGTWHYVMDVTHRWKWWAMLFRPSGWLAAAKSKGVDWSWPERIMPAKSGGREGTRPSDFGFCLKRAFGKTHYEIGF